MNRMRSLFFVFLFTACSNIQSGNVTATGNCTPMVGEWAMPDGSSAIIYSNSDFRDDTSNGPVYGTWSFVSEASNYSGFLTVHWNAPIDLNGGMVNESHYSVVEQMDCSGMSILFVNAD